MNNETIMGVVWISVERYTKKSPSENGGSVTVMILLKTDFVNSFCSYLLQWI